MNPFHSLGPLWRAWCRFYFAQALRQQQEQNPAHPDIPYLVLMNRRLR